MTKDNDQARPDSPAGSDTCGPADDRTMAAADAAPPVGGEPSPSPAAAAQTAKRPLGWKFWLTVGIVVVLVAAALWWLQRTGGFAVFSSPEAMQAYVKGYGAWAPVVFFLLQAAQVVAAPIPGNVTAMAGGFLFGFWKATALSIGATVVGSVAAFALARGFGRPLVVRLVGASVVDKYVDIVSRKGLPLLFAMFLLPFFPDDALCFIAGLAAVSWPVFLLMMLFTRPPGLIMSSLVGSGVVQMPIWGWVLIGAAALALVWLSYRYGEKINEWLLRRMAK